ncbi:hypothetical protein K8I31_05505, partial [bacterium]|nr:hypothetical protein [bacterium]
PDNLISSLNPLFPNENELNKSIRIENEFSQYFKSILLNDNLKIKIRISIGDCIAPIMPGFSLPQ